MCAEDEKFDLGRLECREACLMAARYTIASGLWSDVNTWDGAAAIPVAGDSATITAQHKDDIYNEHKGREIKIPGHQAQGKFYCPFCGEKTR